MANAADKACRTCNDPSMASLIKEQVNEVGQVQANFQSAKSSFEKLATAPDDADANLNAGKFLCFVRGQWDLGLPMLAKGTDKAIKELAALDKAALDAAAQQKAADAWWDYSQTQIGNVKRGVMRRAAYWYEQALPSITGLSKPLAQKRFDEAAATTRQGMARLVNLSPLIQPETDAISGKWEIRKDRLTSDGSSMQRIEMPYEPPAEYDFIVEFTRINGNDIIIQCLAGRNTSFLWAMGANQNTIAGFDLIGGKACGDNKTAVRSKGFFETGRRYTSLVQVRKDVVRAYLNGKLLAEWKTDFKDLSMRNEYRLHNAKALGLADADTSVTFNAIAVIEWSGAGKKTR